MPSRAAISGYVPIRPVCPMSYIDTMPTPYSLALSIARRVAKDAATWPKVLLPLIWAVALWSRFTPRLRLRGYAPVPDVPDVLGDAYEPV